MAFLIMKSCCEAPEFFETVFESTSFYLNWPEQYGTEVGYRPVEGLSTVYGSTLYNTRGYLPAELVGHAITEGSDWYDGYAPPMYVGYTTFWQMGQGFPSDPNRRAEFFILGKCMPGGQAEFIKTPAIGFQWETATTLGKKVSNFLSGGFANPNPNIFTEGRNPYNRVEAVENINGELFSSGEGIIRESLGFETAGNGQQAELFANLLHDFSYVFDGVTLAESVTPLQKTAWVYATGDTPSLERAKITGGVRHSVGGGAGAGFVTARKSSFSRYTLGEIPKNRILAIGGGRGGFSFQERGPMAFTLSSSNSPSSSVASGPNGLSPNSISDPFVYDVPTWIHTRSATTTHTFAISEIASGVEKFAEVTLLDTVTRSNSDTVASSDFYYGTPTFAENGGLLPSHQWDYTYDDGKLSDEALAILGGAILDPQIWESDLNGDGSNWFIRYTWDGQERWLINNQSVKAARDYSGTPLSTRFAPLYSHLESTIGADWDTRTDIPPDDFPEVSEWPTGPLLETFDDSAVTTTSLDPNEITQFWSTDYVSTHVFDVPTPAAAAAGGLANALMIVREQGFLWQPTNTSGTQGQIIPRSRYRIEWWQGSTLLQKTWTPHEISEPGVYFAHGNHMYLTQPLWNSGQRPAVRADGLAFFDTDPGAPNPLTIGYRRHPSPHRADTHAPWDYASHVGINDVPL